MTGYLEGSICEVEWSTYMCVLSSVLEQESKSKSKREACRLTSDVINICVFATKIRNMDPSNLNLTSFNPMIL